MRRCFKAALRQSASASAGASPLNKEITALSRSHEWLKSIQLLDEALRTPTAGGVNIVSFGAALAACDRASLWQDALRLLGEAEPYGANTITWNAAISACARAREWEHACRLLGEMPEASVKPDTISFNSTMRSLTGIGSSTSRWQLAMKLHHELQQNALLPSLTTLSTMTNLCAQGNAWPFALSFLKDALEVKTLLDAASFSSVLVSCARSRRWQRSVALFAELTSSGVTPDLACFNAAISACERGGHWSGAIALLNEMHHMLLAPDLTSTNSIISACEKGCKWQVALHVFAHVVSVSKSKVTFAALLSALTRGKAWQLALSLLDDMRDQEMQPGPLHLTSVLEACRASPDVPDTKTTSLWEELNSSVLGGLHERMALSDGSERCQELTKGLVAGIDALMRLSEGPMETLKLFEEVIYKPVLKSLRSLETEELSLEGLERLEEQYGLGYHFTARALDDLGFPLPHQSWCKSAEEAALQILKQKLLRGPASLPERALARKLLVWSSYDLQAPCGRHLLRLKMKGRSTYAQDLHQQQVMQTHKVPLTPIFVEHDRSNHAERWALMSIISDLLAKGVQPCKFHSVQGDVWLYAVHTPCISCMAVFCQFRKAFPQVSLCVAFRDWSESRQALQENVKRMEGVTFGRFEKLIMTRDRQLC